MGLQGSFLLCRRVGGGEDVKNLALCEAVQGFAAFHNRAETVPILSLGAGDDASFKIRELDGESILQILCTLYA